jgi:hypothetical protein
MKAEMGARQDRRRQRAIKDSALETEGVTGERRIAWPLELTFSDSPFTTLRHGS